MHTFRHISVLGAVALLVATCLSVTGLYGVDAPPLKTGVWMGDSVEYLAGLMILQFDEGADSAARQRIYDAMGAYRVDTCGRCGFEELWFDTSANVPSKCFAIMDSDQVAIAEPAFPCEEMSQPDDPLFGKQWNLENTGQSIYNDLYSDTGDASYVAVSGADIRLPWALEVAAPADSILFGWIDSGVACDPDNSLAFLPIDIDTTHLIRGAVFYPGGDPGFGVADTPIGSHGTTTLSVAAATRNNGMGIAGIAPEARYLIIKLRIRDGAADQCLMADALAYAGQHGVDVINMCMGWRNGLPADPVECEIELLLEQDGALLTNGTDDRPTDPHFSVPGVYASVGRRAGHLDGYRNVLAVGGSNPRDSVWEDSGPMWDPPDDLGYGENGEGICYVTVLAPATCIPAIDGDSTYLALTGLSWGIPQVSALAGLIKAKLGDVPPESLRTVIEMTADKVWQDTGSVAYDPD